MSRKLKFQLGGRDFEGMLLKIDRAKLYGRKEVQATNPQGQQLQKGYLDEWGSVVIASVSMGYLDDARQWHSKNELVAVDSQGRKLEILPSSFDQPIELSEVVPIETYLEHEAAMAYVLKGYGLGDLIELLNQADGVYRFPFSYRAAYDARPAFLIPSGEDLFMVVANPTDLKYLSKRQYSLIDEVDEEGEEEELDDDLDFAMM